jgi:Mg-chelatase subunit ChlD
MWHWAKTMPTRGSKACNWRASWPAAIPALVLDTEQAYVKLGRARQLAEALRAEYLPCEQLSSEQLTITIQARLG